VSAHQEYLLLALEQARSRRGFCAPNPAVGAVLVKDGLVIAQGAHQAAGSPHAEIEVLKIAGEAARGATLYVTLEPCNHQGLTPPCTEAIIQHGIAAVFYAYADPNSQVKGRGAARLAEAALRVEQLSLNEVDEFYKSYAYWLRTHHPFVTAKLALSLDGKIAGANGEPVLITGAEAQHYTHQRRRSSDAILSSVRTIIQDNPRFNVRLGDETISKPLYVIDRLAQLPLEALVLKTASSVTIFHDKAVPAEKLKNLESVGVRCVELSSESGLLSESAVVEFIGQDGIHDLWLEAGGKLFESFYEAQLINRLLFYIAPKTLGAQAYPAFQAPHDFFSDAKALRWFSLGQDVVCEIE
jgi:diaminohydroxyphosphoribosylaminopyrimidine deaminase/5-amino-6-(5-phosphoribosylamino)uracil reductase